MPPKKSGPLRTLGDIKASGLSMQDIAHATQKELREVERLFKKFKPSELFSNVFNEDPRVLNLARRKKENMRQLSSHGRKWTVEALEDFQENYIVLNTLLIQFLGIDRTTLFRWQKTKKKSELIPKKHWAKLDLLFSECAREADRWSKGAASGERALIPIHAANSIAANDSLRGIIGEIDLGRFVTETPSSSDRQFSASGVAQLAPDERECPFCAEVIKRKAILCKHCRSSIEAM